MKPRVSFRIRILGASILVVLLTLVFVAAFLNRTLKDHMIDQVRESLFRETSLVREITAHRWNGEQDLKKTDRLADYIGSRLGLRVTLISMSGDVIGDSEVDLKDLPGTEDHSERPEVLSALKTGQGWNIRRSATIGVDLLYAATILGPPARPGLIVRLALPLEDLEENLGRLRNVILLASLLGVLLSVGVAFVVSYHIFSPIKELTQTALNISSGDLSTRLRRYPNHEIGDLGRAFDRMADHLQEEIEAVTRARDRLEAILRGMVEGVLVTDSNGRTIAANRAIRALLALETNPIGKTPSEIIRNPKLIEALDEVAEGAPYSSLEITTLGPNPKTLEVQAAPLPGPGLRAGVVAVFHDVTERKRTEEMRRDLVANVSHELRTPLAAIRGAVETLLDGAVQDPGFARQFTEMIDRNSRRLEGIVMDLLDLARLEDQKTKTNGDEIPVTILFNAAVSAAADMAQARGVALVQEISDPEIHLKGDHRQLDLALGNLVENAIKYTEKGGEVILSAERGPGEIRISVRDTGIGIPPEHQGRIFERFYRVDKNRSRKMGGTGLGLSIVKHAVQLHGGRVEVSSQPGRGSLFTLFFPDQTGSD